MVCGYVYSTKQHTYIFPSSFSSSYLSCSFLTTPFVPTNKFLSNSLKQTREMPKLPQPDPAPITFFTCFGSSSRPRKHRPHKPGQTMATAAAAAAATTTPFPISTLILALLFLPCGSEAVVDSGCDTGHYGRCQNRVEALRLKLVAIASILVASMVGVCLPLFSRSVPFLRPDRDLFVVVKSFASGVILATGFMHVFPDSFEMLTSPCLPDEPWHKFPFPAFVTMLSTVLTLMVDSFMTTLQSRHGGKKKVDANGGGGGGVPLDPVDLEVSGEESTLLRHRIVAQVLEMGIVVHSVVIGLSMGASENLCTIRPLVAALCFHQLFEGMGLGGCILQAEYNLKIKSIMVFFFSVTTPFGIALGIALTNVYSENSPTELIVVGVLNATSAGLLIYMALVDLLAADFLGSKLQGKARLQGWAYIAVFLGMGGMSLMAKWA